ncbi:MAG: hypothetical protein K9I36_12475 [Bacteroidia bacterium]|nr:hypothetical protein [Bacteroidia bacterium]MCF8427543.1 hypothetical protein [Bacteroidia bacterium]
MPKLFIIQFHQFIQANLGENNGIESISETQFLLHSKNIEITLITYSKTLVQTEPLPGKIGNWKKIKISEDQWFSRNNQVKSRLTSIFGLNQTVAARSCKIEILDKVAIDTFFEENHVQGSCKYAHKLGLSKNGELLAAIAFSKSRVMVDGSAYYRSYELIRFSNKNGITVTGGLSKLLKAFILEKHVQHLMTYIDLDFGDGQGFLSNGFIELNQTPPISFWVDPNIHQRYSEKEIEKLDLNKELLVKFENSGNKKLVYKTI